jgi:hypothetical protein
MVDTLRAPFESMANRMRAIGDGVAGCMGAFRNRMPGIVKSLVHFRFG